MIHNYNANLDTRENRELLNKIFQIQLIKDKFYVPNDIQPNIFRHDLLFGQVREGEGSSDNQRQFSLPVRGIKSAGGQMSGGALISNGRLASHEAIYLEDEMERGHPLRSTPFLGKRGEHSLASGLVKRESQREKVSVSESAASEPVAPIVGSGVFRKKKVKIGGVSSVAIKSATKQKPRVKAMALPMKKLTGQFSILNKVI
jgi:hypothetical protein